MKVPLIVILLLLSFSSIIEAAAQKKILAISFFFKSHYLCWIPVAQNLVEQGYNVSMLLVTDSIHLPAVKETGATPVIIPTMNQTLIDQEAYRLNMEPNNLDGLIDTFALYFQLLTDDEKWIHYLKDQQYDMIIVDNFQELKVFASILDIPRIVQLNPAQHDAILMSTTGVKYFHSTTFNVFRPVIFGMKTFDSYYDYSHSFLIRLQNLLTQIGRWNVHGTKLNNLFKSKVHSRYHSFIDNPKDPHLLLLKGSEGILPPFLMPPNIKMVYPLAKVNITTTKLGGSLDEFLNNNANSSFIVIVFGTTFQPSKEIMQEIISLTQQETKYKFIIADKKLYKDNQNIFKNVEHTKHIFLTDWIPQAELFKNQNVKIIFHHGGTTTFWEALEAKVPQLILPLGPSDQLLNCEVAHMRQMGQCLLKGTLDEIQEKVKVIENNNYYKDQLEQYSKILKVKAKDHDLTYWINQAFEIDHSLLSPVQYKDQNTLALLDMDLILVLLGIVIILILFLCLMLYSFLRLICKVGSSVTKGEKKVKTN